MSPPNQDFLSSLQVMPLIPNMSAAASPGVNPYEHSQRSWQRARPVSAVLALVGMAIEGEPGSEVDPNERESLKLRAAAVRAFEVSLCIGFWGAHLVRSQELTGTLLIPTQGYVVGNPDAQVSIVSGMAAAPSREFGDFFCATGLKKQTG